MAFISIVIPVYNAEDYIDLCVASILKQTFRDWEVILVDDGSSDSSPIICDRYAEQDSRFQVIYQSNAGTSAARNTGVAHASGEYVTFMDNDDWWLNENSLELVVNRLRAHSVDLLCHMSCDANFDGTRITNTASTSIASRVAKLSTEEAISFIVDRELMTRAVWTKIVRKSLLDEHGIVFPIGMRNEDTEWSAKVLAHCRSIGWFDQRFYVYRMGHPYAQTSHKLAVASVDDLERILTENLALADGLPAERASALRAFLAYPYIVWVGQASALKLFTPEAHSRRNLLKQMQEVTSHCNSPLVRAARIASRLVGTGPTATLLGMAFRQKYPQHSA